MTEPSRPAFLTVKRDRLMRLLCDDSPACLETDELQALGIANVRFDGRAGTVRLTFVDDEAMVFFRLKYT